MSDGLRVMIYDKTDIKGWTEELKKAIPGDLDDRFIDEHDLQFGLTHTWMMGGRLYRKFGRFDHVKGFDNWDEALEWLCNLEPEKTIAEIQYWGHGSPGKVWMKGRHLNRHSFSGATYAYGDQLKRLKTRLHEDSLIWFRCCSVFCGEPGYEFAKVWTENLGCRIAAHTFIIGPWQAGLYCIKPGQQPWWPLTEGINEGTPEKPKTGRWSMPWSPRGIPAIWSRMPSWAGPPPKALPS